MRVEKTPMQTLASQLSFDQGLKRGSTNYFDIFFHAGNPEWLANNDAIPGFA